MTTKTTAALNRAREHAATIGEHAKLGLAAEVDGDSTAARRHLRAIAAAHTKLEGAHDAIDRSLASASGEDPITNPTGAMGAQTSSGQSPRDSSPEAVRLRDQRAGIDAAYRRRVALEGGPRR